ncbi:MAG: septum formation protein Maf [Flavobacteriia bacterium]|nr:septum formation protein Maf [Flavobacteriia bacterium]
MKLILGSNSPRRVELLRKMGFDFEQRIADIDETIDPLIPVEHVPAAIALKKMKALQSGLSKDELILCADTLVFIDGRILSKPATRAEASNMLKILSGKMHTVITGVCIGTSTSYETFSDKTYIQFSELSEEEIHFYLNTQNPLDRAGSYGIQDWIGLIGITAINGSYTNVMGLPTHLVYTALKAYQK